MARPTVNYNRDVEIFPVLSAIFKKMQGSSPTVPTDMGVNMAGNCIVTTEVCRAANPKWNPAAVLHRLRRWSQGQQGTRMSASWNW